jgi:hypothetical protein
LAPLGRVWVYNCIGLLLSLLYFIYKVSIPQKSPFEKRILKFLLNPP